MSRSAELELAGDGWIRIAWALYDFRALRVRCERIAERLYDRAELYYLPWWMAAHVWPSVAAAVSLFASASLEKQL